MKKVAILLFTIIYLIPTIGFSVDLHWCGKKVKLVSVNSQHEKKCACSKKMASRCCKDVHFDVKLTGHQMPVSHFETPDISWITLLSASLFSISVSPESTLCNQTAWTRYHAPPDPRSTAVYLNHCNFRI